MTLSLTFDVLHDRFREIVAIATGVRPDDIGEMEIAEAKMQLQARVSDSEIVVVDSTRQLPGPSSVAATLRLESVVTFQGVGAPDAAMNLLLWCESLDGMSYAGDVQISMSTTGIAVPNSTEAYIGLHITFNQRLDLPDQDDDI